MSDVFVELEYNINEDKFKLESNAKDPIAILEHYIRASMGEGSDERKAKTQDIYKIRVEIDLSFDNINCKANTGNNGLTAGIVMHYINKNKR